MHKHSIHLSVVPDFAGQGTVKDWQFGQTDLNAKVSVTSQGELMITGYATAEPGRPSASKTESDIAAYNHKNISVYSRQN